MDQSAAINLPPIVQSLLQGIEHKAGVRISADPPAHDVVGVSTGTGWPSKVATPPLGETAMPPEAPSSDGPENGPPKDSLAAPRDQPKGRDWMTC